ncbi:MAG: DUF2892 domain-containing protein [Nitrospinota bacterium]
MKRNVHDLERLVRVFVGIGLLTQVYWGVQSLWFLLGAVPLLTGLIGWCPPYAMFGISTCSVKEGTK